MAAIFRLTVQEMTRRKFLLLASLLALGYLLVYGFGLFFMNRDLQSHNPRIYPLIVAQMLSMAIYMSCFLSALLVVFATVGSMAGEMENGILHAMIPKPLRRGAIIGGKLAGIAAISVLYNSLLFWAILGLTWLIIREPLLHPFSAWCYYCLQPLVLLAITMYLSVLLPPIAAGVTSFMLYIMGVIGGVMEQFGAFFHNQSLINTGIITSLCIPTDPLYRLINHAVTPQNSGAFALGPFGSSSLPSLWIVVYAFIYLFLFSLGSLRRFSSKDL